MKIGSLLDSIGRDLRYALRGLSRQPGFAFASVITLALGIGATTAIFGVVYSVLLKPLPYPNSDELVRIRHTSRTIADLQASKPIYRIYRDENRAFADIGVWREDSATLTGRGRPDRIRTLFVSDGTLQALGVQPLRGRWFTEREHGPPTDEPLPVILSYAFWQRQFGGDDAVLGRVLSIDSRPTQVVGIMPRDFEFLDMTPAFDVILTERFELADPGWFRYDMLARLQPGVTPAEARADVERMVPIWLAPAPEAARQALGPISTTVRPLKADLVGSVASAIWVLMGAIGAVLLIACANIANLMLVRADARRHEFAIRTALGAGPARIARALLVESCLLGSAGGILGLLFANLGLIGLIAIGPGDLPRLHEISVYPPVLAFTTAISLASIILVGSITVLKHALRSTPIVGGTHNATASRERNATRGALVVVQVALALVLIVSAALMIRSFEALRDVDPGFSDPATIQTAQIWIPTWPNPHPAESLAWTRTQHEILDNILALPGVDSAGLVNDLPIEYPGIRNTGGFAVQGQAPAAGGGAPEALFKYVSPGYFEAMGTGMIAGRGMTWNDIETGGRVAVVSEEFARQLAPDPRDALGKRIRFTFDQDGAWREVIGVAQSIHENGIYEQPPSMVYWPIYMQNIFDEAEIGTPVATITIRSERAGTASFVNEIRRVVRSVNASIPIAQERTMQALYADSLARTSFTLVVLAIAGGMALALGVVGIYGVIAYVVSQRTREIGIRSALGAGPRQLTRMFLLHGLALGAIGVGVGIAAAAALGRLMSSLLFGIGTMDPVAYVVALGVILSAAAVASYVPARRAASIDPMATLSAE